jgi:hypothetical protein
VDDSKIKKCPISDFNIYINGGKFVLHNILIKPYDIWMIQRYRRPTKDKTRTICPTNATTRTTSQQKTKLGTFSNKSQDSNHLSNNIVYRKLLNQRHSIKTLQMVSKILHMFVVACTTFPKHQLSPLNQVVDNRIKF